MYFTWCGQHGGSGDIANDDMHTQISASSTGSVSKIEFQFTYSFQGAWETDNLADYLHNMFPPIFNISAGKRTGTDVFGSGTTVTADHKKK